VISAQPNYIYALQDQAGAPPVAQEGDPSQYELIKMHLTKAHELAKGDRVLVAVIDSGIEVTNPDLAGDIAGYYDALGTGPKPHAHGTAVAGAIAAHGRLMGTAPAAQILAVRAFSGGQDGDAGTAAIRAGLEWAVVHGARVVNMSFAGGAIDPGVAESIRRSQALGVVMVAAAGNHGPKAAPEYPGALPGVIAVTSTDEDDHSPAFAPRGKHIAIAAPGSDLTLLGPSGMLQRLSGTSFSSGYVTGTVALLLQRKHDLTPDAVRQVLMTSAHHLGPGKGPNEIFGAGLIDAYQALLTLEPMAAGESASVTPVSGQR
jgi:subtilisin family serine protease